MKTSREQFEEWVKNNMHPSASNAILRIAWDCWQASRQCIEIELPEVEEPANFFCEVYDTFKIQQALTVAGIKIKGA